MFSYEQLEQAGRVFLREAQKMLARAGARVLIGEHPLSSLSQSKGSDMLPVSRFIIF